MAEPKRRPPIFSGTYKQFENPSVHIQVTTEPPRIKLLIIPDYRDEPRTPEEKQKVKNDEEIYIQPMMECDIIFDPQHYMLLISNLLQSGTWLATQRPEKYKEYAKQVEEIVYQPLR